MKLSPQMLSMLDDIESGNGTHGTAFFKGEHAGRYRTARALRDRGLLDAMNELTDAGSQALANARTNKEEQKQ